MFLLLIASLFAAVSSQDFRINYGSCYRTQEIDKTPRLAGIWDEIRKRGPHAFVWGGDNVYGDYATGGKPAGREVLEGLYNKTKDLPEYKQFVASIGVENIMGTWDDHDFGLNNAGKDNPVKAEAQQALLDFLNVDKDDPRRVREGVYNSQYLANNRIKIILLDIRYHRDGPREKPRDILGDEQWAWLERELNEDMLPTVQATIVVSGIQILPQDGFKTVPVEIWGDFPDAKELLLQTLAKSSAPNVLLVSGDVHHSEISAIRVTRQNEGKEYLIPEMTTSGMTHSLGTSYGFLISKGLQLFYTLNPFSYQYEKLFTFDKNFGEMDFFFSNDELAKVTFRVFSSRGKMVIETTFDAEDLQDKSLTSDVDANIKPVNDVSGFQRFIFYALTILIVIGVVLAVLFGLIGGIKMSYRYGKVAFAKVTTKGESYDTSLEHVTL